VGAAARSILYRTRPDERALEQRSAGAVNEGKRRHGGAMKTPPLPRQTIKCKGPRVHFETKFFFSEEYLVDELVVFVQACCCYIRPASPGHYLFVHVEVTQGYTNTVTCA